MVSRVQVCGSSFTIFTKTSTLLSREGLFGRPFGLSVLFPFHLGLNSQCSLLVVKHETALTSTTFSKSLQIFSKRVHLVAVSLHIINFSHGAILKHMQKVTIDNEPPCHFMTQEWNDFICGFSEAGFSTDV